jgi:hypothetical protein
MATENPKISAYVPQVVYERFKQYQEERQLSMSQAVAQLITEHFGIDLSKGIAEQSTSELPSRLERVEQDLEDLKQKTANLLVQVDELQSTSELPKRLSDEYFSELVSRLSGVLLEKQTSKLPEIQDELSYTQLEIIDAITNVEVNQAYTNVSELLDSSLNSNLQAEPEGESKNLKERQLDEIDASDNSELISSLPSELQEFSKVKINSEALAKRLQVSAKYLINQKSELNYEKFTQWSTDRDPDGIGWQPIKEGRKVYYVPTTSLGSSILAEQESGLLNFQG